MKLSVATKNDIAPLVALRLKNAVYHASLSSSNTLKPNARAFFEEQTVKLIEDKNIRIILAFEGSVMIGYAIGNIIHEHPIFDFGNQGLVDDVYISDEYQGKGYGTKMMDELFKWFKANNIKRLELNVYAVNEKGINFWNKTGFELLFNRMVKQL